MIFRTQNIVNDFKNILGTWFCGFSRFMFQFVLTYLKIKLWKLLNHDVVEKYEITITNLQERTRIHFFWFKKTAAIGANWNMFFLLDIRLYCKMYFMYPKYWLLTFGCRIEYTFFGRNIVCLLSETHSNASLKYYWLDPDGRIVNHAKRVYRRLSIEFSSTVRTRLLPCYFGIPLA